MDHAMTHLSPQRQDLLQRLFPEGFPTLWCPLVTHYADDGSIDRGRMSAHLRHLSPWVGGFLIAGSTGDGWELSEAEARELVQCSIDEMSGLKRKFLIGALKFDTPSVLRSISDMLAVLKRRTGCGDDWESVIQSCACGFTVCAPCGEHLTQDEIRTSLEAVLSLGLPVSLYQLPQITQNEVSSATVAALAAKFPNFYLFKDTSGEDRVAQAGFDQVILLRGAEGDYASHLKLRGGRYDGFLLSSANCFGRELHAIIKALEQGNADGAEALSRKLTSVVDEAFTLAAKLPHGKAFANANKAMDHFFAYGARARRVPPPCLRSGHRLPSEMIEAVAAALTRHDLMPDTGYLD